MSLLDNERVLAYQQHVIAQQIEESRRRFRLHIVWSGVCAAVAILSYTAGVVACLAHIATRMH